MAQLAAAEAQRHFHLVAFFQELEHRAHLHAVVVIIDIWTEFDFLDLDRLLLFAGFVLSFLLFVFELAVIENLTNWWIGVRR